MKYHSSNEKLLARMLKCGVDINHLSLHGYTPLAVTRDLKTFELFLDFGADPNTMNKHNKSIMSMVYGYRSVGN